MVGNTRGDDAGTQIDPGDCHESLRTTKLYDRTNDEITLDGASRDPARPRWRPSSNPLVLLCYYLLYSLTNTSY